MNYVLYWVLFGAIGLLASGGILNAQEKQLPEDEYERAIREENLSVVLNLDELKSFFNAKRAKGEFESIISIGAKLAELAKEQNNKEIEFWSRYLVIEASRRINFGESDAETKKLISELSSSDNVELLALTYKLESDFFTQISNIDSSSHYLELASETIQKVSGFDTSSVLRFKLGQFQHNLAGQLYRRQAFEPAIEIILANIELADEIEVLDLKVRSLQMASAIYSAMGKYAQETNSELEVDWYLEKAKDYSDQFIEEAKKLENDYLTGFAYMMKANQFDTEGKPDSALVYYRESLNYVNREQEPASYISRLNNLAGALSDAGRMEEAFDSFFEAYQLAGDIGNTVLLARISNNLSFTALQLGRLNEARNFANETIAYGMELSRWGTVSQGYGNLTNIEEQSGDFEAALRAYEGHIQYRDSLLKEENLSRIEELQTKYESEKKQAEIELLQNQSELQEALLNARNAQIIIISLVLILFALGVYLVYNRRLRAQEHRVEEANQRLLSVQMNPHFLFNALVAIQSFIIQNREAKETSNFVAKFAKVTRMVLNYSREPLITLEEELSLLHEFLRLQQIRTDHKFRFQFSISEEIDTANIFIPPMLAQPFIENAVEHGILPRKDEDGMISIEITEKEGFLVIAVDDNGVGIAEHRSEHSSHKSLATKITSERFDLLGKIFGKPFTYQIIDKNKESGNSGLRVEFRLPGVTERALKRLT